jgi:hypothetical protein
LSALAQAFPTVPMANNCFVSARQQFNYGRLDGRDYFAGLKVTKRNKATVLLTLTLFQTPTLTYAKFVSKPILKKKVLTKCHSEVSETSIYL